MLLSIVIIIIKIKLNVLGGVIKIRVFEIVIESIF